MAFVLLPILMHQVHDVCDVGAQKCVSLGVCSYGRQMESLLALCATTPNDPKYSGARRLAHSTAHSPADLARVRIILESVGFWGVRRVLELFEVYEGQ